MNLSDSQDELFHVKVFRHCMETGRKRINVYCEFPNRGRLREKIHARSLVVSWDWMDQKRNGAEHTRTNRMENGIESLKTCCSTSVNADTPVFRGSSASERGDLKSKAKGELSFHFCGDDKTVEVVLRTIISVNQLSVYGAAAEMCEELACRISDCSERTGELVAQDNPETSGILTELMTTNKSPRTPMRTCKETCCTTTSNNSQIFHIIFNKLCSNVVITKTVARKQYFTTLHDAELEKLGGSCRQHTFREKRSIQSQRMDSWENTKIGPAFGGGSYSSSRTLRIRDHGPILVK